MFDDEIVCGLWIQKIVEYTEFLGVFRSMDVGAQTACLEFEPM